MKKKTLKSLSLNKFKVAHIDNTSVFRGGNGTETQEPLCKKTVDVTRCNTEFIRICNGTNGRETYNCLTGLVCE